jgi:hypothetical protein
MRTSLSAPRERPAKAVAGTAAYLALVALIVMIFTTSGFVAALAGSLTIGLLVGSYLLERWARRRTIYATAHRPSPDIPADPDPATAESAVEGSQSSNIDESRLAKV